jgi:hypothetical protein
LHEDVQATLAAAVEGQVVPETTDAARTHEDNRGRVEKRICYTTTDLSQIRDRKLWKGLKAVGVIRVGSPCCAFF